MSNRKVIVNEEKTFELELRMCREERHFLHAIQENPDDQLTRNAYCDWLTEQGRMIAVRLIRNGFVPGAFRIEGPGGIASGAIATQHIPSGGLSSGSVRFTSFASGAIRSGAISIHQPQRDPRFPSEDFLNF